MNKYWFRPRSFGWGFTPISWEGWISVPLLLGVIFIAMYTNDLYKEPVTLQKQLSFMLDFAFILIIFSMLAAKKTNGKLKWRWGKYKA